MENYKPERFHTMTPYIVCKNAAAAIEFYKHAFGAAEMMRLAYPDGRIGHAEIMIGDSPMMLADEHPDTGHLSALTIGDSPVGMHLYVPDVDDFCAKAIAAGATEIAPVKDEFYGDRLGRLRDPEGYNWMISTVKNTMSKEELLRVWNEMVGGRQ